MALDNEAAGAKLGVFGDVLGLLHRLDTRVQARKPLLPAGQRGRGEEGFELAVDSVRLLAAGVRGHGQLRPAEALAQRREKRGSSAATASCSPSAVRYSR